VNRPWLNGWLTVRLRAVPISFKVDRRVPFVLVTVLTAILIGIIVNVGVGEYPISPIEVIRTVLKYPTESGDYDFIVNTLRLPRALVAAFAGIALGLAGAIMQGLTRNALASPDITGVTSGASLAVVFLTIADKKAPGSALPIAACVGGLITAFAIYVLAWRRGDSPIRLILVGIGLSAVLGAFTTLLITFVEIYDVQRALIWLTGSVYARSWEEVHAALPWLLVCVPAALLLARDLNTLHLGEEVAGGLGSQIASKRGLLLLISIGLVSAGVAISGAIGFVGLMAPHVARRVVGPQHEGVLPASALFGAGIVVYADLFGRTVLAPTEIPCGIITAIVGVPFFLYLLLRTK
jgi:iron complex transport system permease protein